MDIDNVSSINEKEVMDFYGLKGGFGKLSLRFKILKSVFLKRVWPQLGLQKVPGAKNWRTFNRAVRSRT